MTTLTVFLQIICCLTVQQTTFVINILFVETFKVKISWNVVNKEETNK